MITKRKINYFKKWDSKGYVYNQSVDITKEELLKIQSKHLTEFIKNGKDKDNKIDYYYKLYLKSPNSCKRISSVIFTNHTQQDFFAKVLKISLKNRNTCFIIND